MKKNLIVLGCCFMILSAFTFVKANTRNFEVTIHSYQAYTNLPSGTKTLSNKYAYINVNYLHSLASETFYVKDETGGWSSQGVIFNQSDVSESAEKVVNYNNVVTSGSNTYSRVRCHYYNPYEGTTKGYVRY